MIFCIRFSHVAMILGKMVIQLSKEPSQRLLKHVVSEKFNFAYLNTFELNIFSGAMLPAPV